MPSDEATRQTISPMVLTSADVVHDERRPGRRHMTAPCPIGRIEAPGRHGSYLPSRVKTRPVAWTVPGSFRLIPIYDTPQVRTSRGELVEHAMSIAASCHLLKTASDNRASPSRHFARAIDFSWSYVIAELN